MMMILSPIVLLGMLIFVHELGHFLLAKLLGVKVQKFSLGFGPKLIGKTFGDTEYLISAVPLGGYVKMLGQSDTPEDEDVIPEEEKHRAYNFQPVWKRLLIVMSGPVFNLIFASVIFFFIFLSGIPYLLPEVGGTAAGSPAAEKGLLKGDRIVEIDGSRIKKWEEMTSIIHDRPGTQMKIKVVRGKESFDLNITPQKKVLKDLFGQDKSVGLIGITPSGQTEVEHTNIFGAFTLSVTRTWEISKITVLSLVKLIQRIIPADTIGGPIMIFQMAGQQAANGPLNFFTLMAVISINLGVLNFLPIPVLDGGHVCFLAIESLRRKPLSDRFIANAQKVGLAILIPLMIFALYNDVVRLIAGKAMP